MKVLERKKGTGVYLIKCPGCNGVHSFATETAQSNGAKWGFNGDLEKPTFVPSMLVRAEHGEGYVPFVCHSFVTNGMIQFLGDCSHENKNKTMELPDLEESFINIYSE